MKTLSDFFARRNNASPYGARDLGMSELGLSAGQWARNKDKPIRQLGRVYALALSALLHGLPPYWGDGK